MMQWLARNGEAITSIILLAVLGVLLELLALLPYLIIFKHP
jgi:hypothetical protein